MSLSGPSHLEPTLRPPQERIDQWVHGALLQRANFVLSSTSETVATKIRVYGVEKFVNEFIEYARQWGWAIEPADVPYLKFMAEKLPA